jgi:Anti-sigma-K factor rskA, C-terminal
MNCRDVRAALLAGETSEAISSHLDGCVECRRAVREIEVVRTDLTNDSLWAEPPAGLEDSIVAAITGSERTVGTESIPTRTPERERWTRRTVAAMVGSAAAAVILVVGVLAMANRAPAPDWEAAMIGSDATPSATAVVSGWNTDSGTRVVVEASGLAPAPDGFVYQLWFSEGSQDVSAGTFTDPSHVELTVGVARKDYPDVWIALQPIGTGARDAGQALLYTTDT